MPANERRTKQIARKVLEHYASFDNIASFIHSVDDDLNMRRKVPKSDGNGLVDYFRLGSTEVLDFFKDAFPEIENIEGFFSLLQTFGFNRGLSKNGFFSEALIYFPKDKPGGFIFVQPATPKNIGESEFCLMSQRNRAGNPVIKITGVKDKRILAAEYKFNPLKHSFVQTHLDIGVGQNELESLIDQQPITATQYKLENKPLITQAMLKRAPLHEYILSLGNKPVPCGIETLQKFAAIPQRIPTQ